MILINITRSLWHILDFSIFSDFVVFGLENLVSYLKDREFRAFFFFWFYRILLSIFQVPKGDTDTISWILKLRIS